MVVQHNLQAMNANRMLNVTTSAQSKSTEKLSSGYKINRAADDAAGLSISEKMRKQIRGLDQASSNAEDGISAVQTAEGALTEVHSMLQRMNELAVQASNGTNSEADRTSIQDEINQLTTEIDRVAETTKFNETYLLKGNGNTSEYKVAAHDAGLAGTLTDNENGSYSFKADALKTGDSVSIGGTNYNIVASSKVDDYTSIKEYTAKTGDTLVQDGKTYTFAEVDGKTPYGTTATTAGWYLADNKTAGTPDIADDRTKLKAGSTLTTKADGKVTTLVGSNGKDLSAQVGNATKPGVGSTAWAKGDTITQKQTNGTYKTYSYGTGASATSWYDENGDAQSITIKDGDSYTIKYTGESGQISNNGITTVDTLRDVVRDLADGDTLKIYKDADDTTGKEYTIGVTTKEDGSTMTADDVAQLIKAGNYVEFGTGGPNTNHTELQDKFAYAVPEASESATDIDLQTAYNKMAEELTKASSIGTDKAATVTSKGDGSFTIQQGSVSYSDSLSFQLHVGADADMTNKIGVDIHTMSSAYLGVKNLDVVGGGNDGGAAATYAIDAIADAIAKVSEQRSTLGAVQNRLEHTVNNLDNVVENTTSAESRIRDTDMAEEMVEYSKNNILAQAGQSMLAQANNSTQGVLSLLG